jgi:hypothetical protein
MTTYERIEFAERARRVFNPNSACQSAVKTAINRCSDTLGVSWNRARDLLRGKALPTVREMDIIREKDGVWCTRLKRAKARIEDKIEDIWEFVADLKARRKAKREARLSQKSVITRMYQDNRA